MKGAVLKRRGLLEANVAFSPFLLIQGPKVFLGSQIGAWEGPRLKIQQSSFQDRSGAATRGSIEASPLPAAP